MTNQEELCKAAQDAYPNWIEAQCHFIDGGHWQKERLANRACEWLKGFMRYSTLFEYIPSEEMQEEAIKDFKNYLED